MIRDYSKLKVYLSNPHVMHRINYCLNKDFVTSAKMKSEGVSFDDIAKHYGVQTSTARRRVAEVLDHIEKWLNDRINSEKQLVEAIFQGLSKYQRKYEQSRSIYSR